MTSALASTLNIQQHLEKKLLEQNELTKQQLEQTLQTLMQHDTHYADVYLEYTEQESWRLDEGMIKGGSFHIDQGMSLRSFYDEHTRFVYASSINAKQLKQLLQAQQNMIAIGQHVKQTEQFKQNKQTQENKQTIASLYQQSTFFNSLDNLKKIEILNKIDKIARKHPLIHNVSASLVGSFTEFMVARGDGLITGDAAPLVRLSITLTLKQGQVFEKASSGGGGRYDYSYFTDEKIDYYIKQAIAACEHNFIAKPAPAGVLDVVLGAGWPGILLHEAIGHGLEGDFNRKGSSVFSQKLGSQIASKGVTIVDDGTLKQRRGSINIDDEGNQSQYNTLIEDGILVNYLQDEMNARLMNRPVTGNGRRENYQCTPMPRMTNTYMLNGNYSPEDIIGSVKHGIYASQFDGGQVDITSGQFVFAAQQAFLIENGKLTTPIKGATLIGSGAESLLNIKMVGNNIQLDEGVGTCGKQGQSVPVGVGQPTLLIGQMTVGGSQIYK